MSIKLGKLKIGGRHGVEIGGHSLNPADLAGDAKHQIDGIVQTAIHEVEGAAQQGIHGVEGAANDAVHHLENAANDALREIEHGLEDLRDEIFKGLAKLSIKKAIDILQATVPDSFTLTIGPFAFQYDNPNEKIDTLQHYADHPPSLDHMKDIVLALAPTVVSVSLSAELAFLLVSSNSLSVGFQADYEVENFISRFDAIKGQLGV